MLAKLLKTLLFFAIAMIGVVPVLLLSTNSSASTWLTPQVVAALNLLAWSLVLTFLFSREDLKRSMVSISKHLGLNTQFKNIESQLQNIVREVDRKNNSLSINLIEKRISSKEELSKTLERIVALSFKLLNAESAELALFDKESGLYHSSFVLGKPFRSSAQAMLSGALGESESQASPDVMIHPISFSGSILGSLRVALKKGNLPTPSDQEIIKLLSLQGSLALINAQYSSELVKMRRVSEESVKAKTGFLANLSHELRGPLGIMLNAVELVLEGLCGPVTTDQVETLKMVRGNGQHLLELINDVLDYAKSESGKLAPNKVEILLQELLQDLVNVVRTQADAKKHKLAFKAHNEALAIACDRRHARQMLINMLTNAIKYTPEGGNIEVWAERITGNKVKISVKDSGVGIEESERYKVFSPFERVENSYSITQAGTGLGMPLTKRLAEINGGVIDFSSIAGKGSQFWLIFPIIEFDPASKESSNQEVKEAKGQGEIILLIQRAEGERGMIAKYLNHRGFKVFSVDSQLEALDVLEKNSVAAVLIDNNVVDRGLDDMISEIRSNQKNVKTPIALLSSKAFVFDIEKYLMMGVDRCLSKPMELNQIGLVCRELIDNRREQPVSSKASAKKTVAPLSKAFLRDDILH